MIGLITSGDPSFWEIRYKTGGDLNVRAWRNFQSLVWDTTYNFNLDGKRGQLAIELNTSGSAVTWTVTFLEVGKNYSVYVTNSIA